jgi:SAM-dependent methyltransferase
MPGRPDRGLGRPERERPPAKPYRTGVQSAGEGPPRPVPAPEDPPLSRIRVLLGGYQQSAALLAAYSLGVFAEIHKLPQVAGDIARHCGADLRGIEALLEALVAMGVIHRHGTTYVLPREHVAYLVPGADGDATGMMDLATDLYVAWGDLARGIREGAPRFRLSSEAILSGDPGRVRRYIRAVHTVSREAAHRVTELAPLLPGSSLLDVAGGSGVFAAEYARRTPDLKAHLFDLPPTLEVARDILVAEGYEDNVAFHPGDYRQDSFPGPVDTILLSNVFQTESEEHVGGILRRSWEALRPGGTLLVHGVMAEGQGPPSREVALFSLLMYVVFDQGRAWSAEQICEWLARERFGVRAVRALGSPFPSKLIIATRLE